MKIRMYDCEGETDTETGHTKGETKRKRKKKKRRKGGKIKGRKYSSQRLQP